MQLGYRGTGSIALLGGSLVFLVRLVVVWFIFHGSCLGVGVPKFKVFDIYISVTL